MRYGPIQFGHQCLIARRLVEAGVPFVEVARAWWDSHGQNFGTHQELCADLDHSMSVLLDDLEARGLEEHTGYYAGRVRKDAADQFEPWTRSLCQCMELQFVRAWYSGVWPTEDT